MSFRNSFKAELKIKRYYIQTIIFFLFLLFFGETIAQEAPKIIKQLEDQSVELGGTAIFEVEVSSDNEVTYKWEFNGKELIGATTSKLVLFNIQSQNQGEYSVIVTDDNSSTIRDTAKLIGSNVAPLVLSQTDNLSSSAGKNIEISVEASGAKPMMFQWFFDGVPIDGGKASNLTLKNVSLDMEGIYYVEITNEYGSINSQTIELIVMDNLQEALDNSNFYFDSGPEESWVIDDFIHTDEEDSARSPMIDNNQSTWVEMDVEGPGTVFFDWRTTNDYGQEFECFLNDRLVASFVKGYSWEDPQWNSGAVRLDEGEYVIRWEYRKQGAFGQGMFGWLDNIVFMTQEEIMHESLLALGLQVETPIKLSKQGSWLVDEKNGLDEDGGLVSSGIPAGGKGWLEVTLEGPGYLDFHYRPVDQFSWGASLAFVLDGKNVDMFSAMYSTSEEGWSRSVIEIPEGEHKARWIIESRGGTTTNFILDWVEFISVNRFSPEIDLEPESVSVEALGFAVFEVEARGYPFPSYQWYIDGEPIQGAINRTLTMENLWAEDSGDINVVISNNLGQVESEIIELNVNEIIDEELAKAIDMEDAKVVSVSMNDEFEKPWKLFNSKKSADGEDSARAYSSSADWSTESIFAVRLEGPGYLNFKWRLESARTLQEYEIIEVYCSLNDKFAYQNEQILALHTNAKSSSVAQWIDNRVIIPNGKHTVYFGFYKDADQLGRAYVDEMSFEAVEASKPSVIFAKALDLNLKLGGNLDLSVDKFDGFPFPDFQWKLDGEIIENATNNIYSVERAWTEDAGNYTVVASNNFGTVESEVLLIEVKNDGVELAEGLDVEGLLFAAGGDRNWIKTKVSNAQGEDAVKVVSTKAGQSSWLITQVEGPGIVQFEWKMKSSERGDYLTFAIDGVPVSEKEGNFDWQFERFFVPEGEHYLEWTFDRFSFETGLHNAYLDSFKFSLPKDSAPEFVEQPEDFETEGIGSAKFVTEVDGWPFPQLQWYLNGKALAGKTDRILSFDSVWPEDVGEIWVVAKNKYGEVKSQIVELKNDTEIDEDLSDALDTQESFLSSPEFDWVWQPDETFDDEDALLVTGLPDWDFNNDIQYAELKTRVQGPGELTFKAKIEGDLQIFRAIIGESYSIWDDSFITIRDQMVDWKEYKIDIPKGSQTVTFLFLQGPKNGGPDSSLWLDQFKYERFDTEINLSYLSIENDKMMLNFNSVLGQDYELQSTLGFNEWKPEKDILGDGGLMQIEVTIDTLKQFNFYRIKKVVVNFEGKWIGKGYECWGDLDINGNPILLNQEISISQSGDYIIATKVTGDTCVKAGEKTWEGQIIGDRILGKIYGRGMGDANLTDFPITGEILDNGFIQIEDIVFEKVDD